jgi:hypothetical protein
MTKNIPHMKKKRVDKVDKVFSWANQGGWFYYEEGLKKAKTNKKQTGQFSYLLRQGRETEQWSRNVLLNHQLLPVTFSVLRFVEGTSLAYQVNLT